MRGETWNRDRETIRKTAGMSGRKTDWQGEKEKGVAAETGLAKGESNGETQEAEVEKEREGKGKKILGRSEEEGGGQRARARQELGRKTQGNQGPIRGRDRLPWTQRQDGRPEQGHTGPLQAPAASQT